MDRPPFQDPNAAGGQPGGAAHFSQQHGRTGRMHQPTPSGSFPSHPAPGQQPSQASTPSPLLHGPPQLPPQLFTTAAQLLDLTDSMVSCFLILSGVKLVAGASAYIHTIDGYVWLTGWFCAFAFTVRHREASPYSP
jgi:hypothetical protein